MAPLLRMSLASDDLGDVVGAGVVEDRSGHRLAGECHDAGAQILGQPQGSRHPRLHFPRCAPICPRLDMDRAPFGPEVIRQPSCRPHQVLSQRARADANQQPLSRRPWAGDSARLHVGHHLFVDSPGGTPQRHLAQGSEVPLAEESLQGDSGRVGHVHFALVQTLDQLIWRQVDKFDLCGLIEDAVRQGFPNGNAGNLGNGFVQALKVLDVERGVYVDPVLEQIVDIMIAFWMARPRGIGMCQLVNHGQLRMPGEDGVDIHFGDPLSANLHLMPGYDLQGAKQSFSFDSAVGFDETYNHVHALDLSLARCLEHGIRFPHAGRVPEEDLESAAFPLQLLGFHMGEKFVRVRLGGAGHARAWWAVP
jgi:hypothetical protein